MLTSDAQTVVNARLPESKISNTLEQIKYLPALLPPQNVAIIIVSENKEKIGYALAKNTADTENVFCVNPYLRMLFNKKVYNTIEELPLLLLHLTEKL